MSEASRHDAWRAGDGYERYMGRWSRRIAPRFLEWLAPGEGLDWLEVGCGTGALTEAILARAAPRAITAVDASADFLDHARRRIGPDARAGFLVGDARELPVADASFDVAASGLVLNFVPDPAHALAEMRRAVRPGGRIGFYVWDYPGGGVEFMHAFWAAASALDPAAAELSEDRRFAFCTPDALLRLAAEAGLHGAACAAIEARSDFDDFDDFWLPFTLGAGPAPGYCVKLPADRRDRLREALRAQLPAEADGSLSLGLRAWAVAGDVR